MTSSVPASSPPALKTRTGEHFVPITACVVEMLDELQVDVFVCPEGTSEPVLYRRRGFRDVVASLETVPRDGKLYVRTTDLTEYYGQLQEDLDRILHEDAIPAEDRFSVLQSAAAIEIERSFSMINCSQAVRAAEQVGRQIVDLLRGSNALPRDVFRIVRHDYFTFTHVTNVAGYATMLAERLGISGQSDLEAIATGGLLHDLGKRLIPKSILCKPGRLTPEDWAVIEQHPQRGYEELCDRDDLVHGQLMMVYQHHEKIDGTGYPVGVVKEDIHPWARLCAVVDVFDAMTGERPYRRRLSLAEVLEHIQGLAGTHLDEDMARCWVELMSIR